jgi:hypothetical protein
MTERTIAWHKDAIRRAAEAIHAQLDRPVLDTQPIAETALRAAINTPEQLEEFLRQLDDEPVRWPAGSRRARRGRCR